MQTLRKHANRCNAPIPLIIDRLGSILKRESSFFARYPEAPAKLATCFRGTRYTQAGTKRLGWQNVVEQNTAESKARKVFCGIRTAQIGRRAVTVCYMTYCRILLFLHFIFIYFHYIFGFIFFWYFYCSFIFKSSFFICINC